MLITTNRFIIWGINDEALDFVHYGDLLAKIIEQPLII